MKPPLVKQTKFTQLIMLGKGIAKFCHDSDNNHAEDNP